jgi:hypothetical protein
MVPYSPYQVLASKMLTSKNWNLSNSDWRYWDREYFSPGSVISCHMVHANLTNSSTTESMVLEAKSLEADLWFKRGTIHRVTLWFKNIAVDKPKT